MLAALTLATLLLAGTRALAHEVRPAIADLAFDGAGGYTVTISLNLEALVAEIGPDHEDTASSPNAVRYDTLRALPPEALAEAFERFAPQLLAGIHLAAGGTRLTPAIAAPAIPPIGDLALARISTLTLTGTLPADVETLTWAWDERFGAIVLRLATAPDDAAEDEQDLYAAYLQNGATSEPIPVVGAPRQSLLAVIGQYLEIGFTHILPKGLDHILFVVGLFLLSTRLGALLWQISSFTVAHTVTLALGVLEVVHISPAIVEPLIAASIIYVCVENVISDKLQRWRPVVVFGFGLLHGLGLAGVLNEVGLQSGQLAAGLIAFNVGVELGQLTVIAGCFLAVGLWFRRKSYYRRAVTIPASVVIAAIGAFWLVERTLL